MEAAAIEARRLRWRISILLVLKYQLAALAVSGFLLGVVILVLRAALAIERKEVSWALVAFVPGAAWALIAAARRFPSGDVLFALIDGYSRCGGLVMASREVQTVGWLTHLTNVRRPVLKWRSGRSVGLSLAAIMFFGATLLLPQRYVQISTAAPLNISEDIGVLQKQIDTLKIEEVITADAADTLRQKLEQIRQEASGSDPVKTWEALDHIERSLNKTAADFAEGALNQTEALARNEAMAQGLSMIAESMTPEEISRAMSALSEMMKSLLADNEQLKEGLSSECLSACEKGGLSGEQLAELLKALKDAKGNVSDRLKRLCEAGLIDLKMLALCEKMGECNMEGLAAFLAENAGMGMGEALCFFCENPGRGGVTRGPGDAPMIWTDGSSEEGAAYKDQVLPPASLEALRQSVLIGISAGDPTETAQGQSADVRVLSPTEAVSGEAFKHVILPRHKGTVERYFNR